VILRCSDIRLTPSDIALKRSSEGEYNITLLHLSQKKARESALFSTMCSAVAERDASFGRDVWLRQVVCASRVSGTHHIIATAGSGITYADGANISLHAIMNIVLLKPQRSHLRHRRKHHFTIVFQTCINL
jgi:hypothetical protein